MYYSFLDYTQMPVLCKCAKLIPKLNPWTKTAEGEGRVNDNDRKEIRSGGGGLGTDIATSCLPQNAESWVIMGV